MYDIFPRGMHGNNNYYYLRTQGLGWGTLYIHVDAGARRTRAISSINHRHRRYTSADIEPISIQHIPTLDIKIIDENAMNEDRKCEKAGWHQILEQYEQQKETKAENTIKKELKKIEGTFSDDTRLPSFMFKR